MNGDVPGRSESGDHAPFDGDAPFGRDPSSSFGSGRTPGGEARFRVDGAEGADGRRCRGADWVDGAEGAGRADGAVRRGAGAGSTTPDTPVPTPEELAGQLRAARAALVEAQAEAARWEAAATTGRPARRNAARH